KFRPGSSARGTRSQLSAELMLMFRFGKIAKHVRRRAEKDKPPALIEQDRFVKHLEKFGARLVNRDDDDLVVRHAANDLDDVLGVFRGEAGSWLIEEVNVRHTDHVEADVEAFAFAAAQRLLHRAAYDRVPTLAQAEFNQFRIQAAHAVASREMRRTHRRRELQI